MLYPHLTSLLYSMSYYIRAHQEEEEKGNVHDVLFSLRLMRHSNTMAQRELFLPTFVEKRSTAFSRFRSHPLRCTGPVVIVSRNESSRRGKWTLLRATKSSFQPLKHKKNVNTQQSVYSAQQARHKCFHALITTENQFSWRNAFHRPRFSSRHRTAPPLEPRTRPDLIATKTI